MLAVKLLFSSDGLEMFRSPLRERAGVAARCSGGKGEPKMFKVFAFIAAAGLATAVPA